MMKRYWLFLGDNDEAQGGMYDFYSGHDTLPEAQEAGKPFLGPNAWAHVFDSQARAIVLTANGRNHWGRTHCQVVDLVSGCETE
jgi:hypothetical protein